MVLEFRQIEIGSSAAGDKLVSVASAYYEKEVSFEIASGESVAELPVEVEKNLEGGSSITDFIYESSDETALVINAQNEGDTSAVVSLLCSGTTGCNSRPSISSCPSISAIG